MHNPFDIANHILKLAYRADDDINTIKLIKLVVISHGYHLAFTEKPLLNEAVRCYQFGPIIESLYYNLLKYGNEPLSEDALSRHCKCGFIPDSVKNLLEAVYDSYKILSPDKISTICSKEGSPWHRAMQESGGYKRFDLDDKYLMEYYKENLSKGGKNGV